MLFHRHLQNPRPIILITKSTEGQHDDRAGVNRHLHAALVILLTLGRLLHLGMSNRHLPSDFKKINKQNKQINKK
jgi:hypothetical protein